MPNEATLSKIEELLEEIVTIGGTREKTGMVPNLEVIDDSPIKTNFILVKDNRDGDNILARKVPGVIYTNGDFVNVLFVEAAEPIAFQKGSESSSSNIWDIVPSTTTDIFYNSGNVGIGTTGPDTKLDVLNASGVQLRLTHTDGTKFVDFTLDTNEDLTVTPSSTGQIIFQPTTDSDSFFRVLNSLGTIRVFSVDTVNERVGINTVGPDAKLDVVDDTIAQLRLTHTDGTAFADFRLDGSHNLTITPSSTGQIILQPTTDSIDFFQVLDADGGIPVLNIDSTNERVGIGTASPSDILDILGGTLQIRISDVSTDATNKIGRLVGRHYTNTEEDTSTILASSTVSATEVAIGGGDTPRNAVTLISFWTAANNTTQGGAERMRIDSGGLVGVNATTMLAQLHVDQTSTTAAIPALYLDQADVDEPFIKFVGTAAAATLTRSIVAESDVTTATRQGFVMIEIDDIGNQVADQDYFVAFYTIA